ncbi:MAG: Re/Si-specific NAD(P)(+) transhydrogenase subunit alpha [Pseudomonadales bacterium]|nr:Re/Si-specific NAD(P)(+) transhydrogenase subunit alpha [Pseudomonadales bacterium]
MKIAIPLERRPGELRVASSPDVVKKLTALGYAVVVESGAGLAACFTDQDYQTAGATIVEDNKALYLDADVIFKVQRPIIGAADSELALLKEGAILIAHLSAISHPEDIAAYAQAGITSFALEKIPRISRAQSMDILSSQTNLTGYKAVVDAASLYAKAFPLMMTAAGTVAPAKVFIMGVGVAGLQAIATAKRLGAVVTAYDVRPIVKEQVESLGGKFLEVDSAASQDAETSGGYAKEMNDDYKHKEQAIISEHIARQDIIICTALIPGRPAPVLVTAKMVKSMKTGSIIIDLAVEMGGNCPLSEQGKVVTKHGVTIVGYDNYPSRLAADSSALYAKNLLNFFLLLSAPDSPQLQIDWDDEIIGNTLVSKDHQVVSPS